MRSILIRVITSATISPLLFGCGYTILRNLEQEAIQAEWAAVDSMRFLPDLTISDVEYEHHYHPGPQNVFDPIDSRGFHIVTFHLTIKNIGNTDFHKPYMIVFVKEDPQLSETNTFLWKEFNKGEDTIKVGGMQALDLLYEYPFLRSSYNFVILTNPIIQHKVFEELTRRTHAPQIPLARESRYDNNSARIILPAFEELLHGAQQDK